MPTTVSHFAAGIFAVGVTVGLFVKTVMSHHILILGGTTEARLLAGELANNPALTVTLSLAGRTRRPLPQPAPTRSGGFGGVPGLIRYLHDHQIDLLIDATHPFAQQMSEHAAAAAQAVGLPHLAIRRPPWQPAADDDWRMVDDLAAALRQIGPSPQRIFVAFGRQELTPLLVAPQHHYLVRSVDPVTPPLALPKIDYLLGRGPFKVAAEAALLRDHGVQLIIAKNSGGAATSAKLHAARALGLPCYLIRRPPLPAVDQVPTVAAAQRSIAHWLSSGDLPSDANLAALRGE